jgi:hypothetical protein
MEKLVVGPLKTTQIHTLIIIDAVDECKDQEAGYAFVLALSKYMDQIPNAKLFIAGRPVGAFRSKIILPPLSHITKEFRLDMVERSSVDKDIKRFLKARLMDIAKEESYCRFPKFWPSQDIVANLCWKAVGLFVRASTFIEFIASKSHLPARRLVFLAARPWGPMFSGLWREDILRALEQAFREDPHVEFVRWKSFLEE